MILTLKLIFVLILGPWYTDNCKQHAHGIQRKKQMKLKRKYLYLHLIIYYEYFTEDISCVAKVIIEDHCKLTYLDLKTV
jgi:hypothetical protein